MRENALKFEMYEGAQHKARIAKDWSVYWLNHRWQKLTVMLVVFWGYLIVVIVARLRDMLMDIMEYFGIMIKGFRDAGRRKTSKGQL